MMGLNEINRLSEEAGKKAKRKTARPFIFRGDTNRVKDIPNFGDYRPKGWKLVRELFVDKSGFGREGEPAMTIGQFKNSLKVGHGYAMIQEGQFQCYVGEFVTNEGLKGD